MRFINKMIEPKLRKISKNTYLYSDTMIEIKDDRSISSYQSPKEDQQNGITWDLEKLVCPYYVKIPLFNYDLPHEYRDWIAYNLKGIWWVMRFDGGNHAIRFELEEDALAFKLWMT